jgi:excisionase family DNA binding protein
MELLRLHEAAQLVGVSHPTLEQRIYYGKIKSVKTAGGHNRIPKSEIARLTGADKRKASSSGDNKIIQSTPSHRRPTGLHAKGLWARDR